MKQFSRCSNCRQWYTHAAVQLVEIVRGTGLQQTAWWCESCIRAAEELSQLTPVTRPDQAADELMSSAPLTALPQLSNHGLSQLFQEHLDLMEHALQEDDDTIIPLVEDFVQRCETTHVDLTDPDQVKRLAGHMKYWSTFLITIKQSRQ